MREFYVAVERIQNAKDRWEEFKTLLDEHHAAIIQAEGDEDPFIAAMIYQIKVQARGTLTGRSRK